MGRARIQDDNKAQSVPLSLKPKHVKMLEEMEKKKKLNRSKIIQRLIIKAYRELKENNRDISEDYGEIIIREDEDEDEDDEGGII